MYGGIASFSVEVSLRMKLRVGGITLTLGRQLA